MHHLAWRGLLTVSDETECLIDWLGLTVAALKEGLDSERLLDHR